MKFIKGLFAFLLIVIIVGGVGYLAYNLYFMNLMPGNGMNMSSDNMGDTSNNTANDTTNDPNNDNKSDMSDMDMSSGNMNQPVAIPNPEDGKNREKLNEAIALINKAMDQITIDPYSQATITEDSGMQMNGSMGAQVTGTINIYPSDNSSVNITPNETPQVSDTSQPTMAGMNMDDSTKDTGKTNHVYDQMKLQQLHSGIYTIAQGLAAIEELNESLLGQSMILEEQPFTYQTYVLRYNKALKNKAELEKVMSLLDSASILINVNPYASDSGYTIDSGSMNQLHEGVYKFAQGMALLESLNQDFISQMTAASMSAQNEVSFMGQMNVSSNSPQILRGVNLSTIFNIIIIVLIIGLIIGVLGAILNLFKHKTPANS